MKHQFKNKRGKKRRLSIYGYGEVSPYGYGEGYNIPSCLDLLFKKKLWKIT